VRGRDALVLAQHRHHCPELTAPCPSPAPPLSLWIRTYASRAERVCVSDGVNKHHTTVIRTVPTHSPAFIAPAFPAPEAIWAAFHPGTTCMKQPLSPPTAPCKTPTQTCAHGKRASLQRGDPLRIPLTLTLGQTTTTTPPTPHRTMSPATYWHPRARDAVNYSPAHAHCRHSGSALLNQHGTDTAAVMTTICTRGGSHLGAGRLLR
jgi:hypothetical protein